MSSRLSRSTLVVYDAAWSRFVAWCEGLGFESGPPTPAHVLGAYISELADPDRDPELSLSSLHQARAAVDHRNAVADAPLPGKTVHVRNVWFSVLEHRGDLPERFGYFQMGEVVGPDVRSMVRAIEASDRADSLLAKRDRLLLLLGAGAALRPAELASVEVDDVIVEEGKLGLALDFELYGGLDRVRLEVGDCADSPLDIVTAFREWIDASGLSEGPLFRGVDRHGTVADGALSTAAIGKVVRRWAGAAGLPEGTGTAVLRWRLREDGVESS